jgi:hypothetical protein
MGNVKVIRANNEGLIEGVRVIALHGHLHPTETPARYSPVYVDDANYHLRIVDIRTAPHGFDVVVETARPPLPETGELPGHATRVGPWQARLHWHAVVVGPSEIERAERMKPRSALGEPPTVERFVHSLLTGRDLSGKLDIQRVQGAAIWYCSKAESFALWKRIHGVVQDEFFEAAQLFLDRRPGARTRLEEVSWWLSRAAIEDQDIYRAAAGLKRAGSSDWRIMLREGLRIKNEQGWEAGLKEAEQLLDRPPAPEHSAPKAGLKLAHVRAAVRSKFTSDETEPAVPEKGTAAA